MITLKNITIYNRYREEIYHMELLECEIENKKHWIEYIRSNGWEYTSVDGEVWKTSISQSFKSVFYDAINALLGRGRWYQNKEEIDI